MNQDEISGLRLLSFVNLSVYRPMNLVNWRNLNGLDLSSGRLKRVPGRSCRHESEAGDGITVSGI